MDANTIIAVCATVIAVASLVVSIAEARAMRRHNRQSVRPLLSFECTRREGHKAGIRLRNAGLGPAIITGSAVMVDNHVLGPWELRTVNPLRDTFPSQPMFESLRAGKVLPAGYDGMLLSVDEYDSTRDAFFWRTVSRGIRLTARYESLYGEEFEAVYTGTLDGGISPPESSIESQHDSMLRARVSTEG